MLDEEREFRIGDIVIGNGLANDYGITAEGWKGEVVGISKRSRRIYLKDANGPPPFMSQAEYDALKPEIFTVKAKAFSLLHPNPIKSIWPDKDEYEEA